MERNDIIKKKGFSLLELLVAVAILGVILVTVCGVFIHGLNSIKKGKEIALSLTLANKKIDELNNLELRDPNGIKKKNLCEMIEGYAPVSILPENTYISWGISGEQEITGVETRAGIEYRFTIKIKGFQQDLKKITVEITHPGLDPQGTKKIEINTLLARKITIQ
jgi:prepilin-type N-terminal cleavage/methylation domain-containing protein